MPRRVPHSASNVPRGVAAVIVVALFAVACASTPEVIERAVPTEVPAPTATELPQGTTIHPTPEPEPEPTPELVPTDPTPKPEPEATPDGTPIVLAGDGWTISQQRVDELAAFAEDVHGLRFDSVVGVRSSDDIGAEFIADFEVFSEEEWWLLAELGLLTPGAERADVNAGRRDRVRGMCCIGEGDELEVVVEPRATRLETEMIVVHELVHALHNHNRDLVGRPGRSGGFEYPSPYRAMFEAIAQFVAFEWLAQASQADQAAVADDLAVTDDTLAAIAGRVPGEYLNFSYGPAIGLAAAAHAEGGAQGLIDLLGRPPTTTEQVSYPDRWLADEDRVSQERPDLPSGARFENEGRLGVSILGWMLDEVAERSEIDRLLAEWTGDRWARYQVDGRSCLSAVVEMDSSTAASRVGELLESRDKGAVAGGDSAERVVFDTCV